MCNDIFSVYKANENNETARKKFSSDGKQIDWKENFMTQKWKKINIAYEVKAEKSYMNLNNEHIELRQ